MSTITYQPASELAHLLVHKDKSSKLVLLSGPSGSGKSTLCQQIVDRARCVGLVTGGLISLAVFANGRKIGIDLVDQLTGERRRLAIRRCQEPHGIQTKDWLLDPQVLAWGNQRLLELPPCHVVIVDELGPLEFRRKQGLQAGLTLIDSQQVPRIIAVIRPKLLPLARERWPWGAVLALDSAGEVRDWPY